MRKKETMFKRTKFGRTNITYEEILNTTRYLNVIIKYEINI